MHSQQFIAIAEYIGRIGLLPDYNNLEEMCNGLIQKPRASPSRVEKLLQFAAMMWSELQSQLPGNP